MNIGAGKIEIVQPGMGASVQDAGRHGYRHDGMPVSGWLDAPLAHAANALVGNAIDAAVMELRGAGTQLRIQVGPVRVALAGVITAHIVRVDGTRRTCPAWQTTTLQSGEHLHLGAAETGCAYLAVSGGLQLPPQLGSRASYGRAGLQGLQGRAWQPGDVMPCDTVAASDKVDSTVQEWRAAPWLTPSDTVRVVWGPQQDHFSAQALALFEQTTWTTSAEQDRMGMRLRGPTLSHVSASAADIVSDAVTPGAIQVPANGLPIVLLADSQTVGGYPKIATVIRADLPKLAHARAGTSFRFEVVSLAQARQAWHDQQRAWTQWLGTREAFLPAGYIDEQALYGGNLVSGMLLAQP